MSRLVRLALSALTTCAVVGLAGCAASPSSMPTSVTVVETVPPTSGGGSGTEQPAPAPALQTPPSTSVPGPDQTAEVQALLDAAPAGSTVVVDRQYTVDGTVVVPRALNVVFTPSGVLVRAARHAGVRVRPLLVLDARASGSRFDQLRVRGPLTCDFQWPPGKATWVATYDPTTEAQHAVDIRGGDSFTFDSPNLSGMPGDGFNLVGNVSRVAVNNPSVSCVGRNAVSNTGSSSTTVTGGALVGSGLWNVDVEPFGANAVAGFTVTGTKMGMSSHPWMNADGPDFNCRVTNVVFDAVDLSGAYPLPPAVRACVAGAITGV